MARHPAPPFYRSRNPGKGAGRHRVTPSAPANGRHRANASVVPVVHADMLGNRTLLVDRSVIVSAQRVVLD